MRLSEKEIEKRLTRLRNLEGMYARQVSTNRKLKEENKRLKARIVELEKENKELKDRLEGLELVVEELKTLNFMGAREDELNKIYQSFDELTNSVDQEPEKLTNLRKSLLKNKEKYFTCLYHKGVPTTNNTAERVLRPLVIKRKLSFGSKTSDGATMMETLYSVVFSLLAKSKTNFFDIYLAL